MASVTFYAKPGCKGNARQMQLLRDAGHQVEERNLFETPWSENSLMDFFQDLPVEGWFNRNAPDVKAGAVVPEKFNRESALKFLIHNPMLIRRPLLESGGVRMVGFPAEEVDSWLGLAPGVAKGDLESCPAPEKECKEPIS